MGATRIKTRAASAALMAVLLLTAGGCGGDADDDDASRDRASTEAAKTTGGDHSSDDAGSGTEADPASDPGSAAEPGVDLGLCTLLEPAEFEAQFSEVGSVTEGNDFGRSDQCFWESEIATGFHLAVEPRDLRTVDERTEGSLSPPVAVDGLGDDAYYVEKEGQSVLFVELGENVFSVQATYVAGVQERLVALAEIVLSRL